MSIIPWQCAHGDAPVGTVYVVDGVAELHNVDSNIVRVVGDGEIRWFGLAPWVTKRVVLSRGLKLIHSSSMITLTERDRKIDALSVGTYTCDGRGNWMEVHFTSTGAQELSRRLDAFEQRLIDLERKLEGIAYATGVVDRRGVGRAVGHRHYLAAD